MLINAGEKLSVNNHFVKESIYVNRIPVLLFSHCSLIASNLLLDSSFALFAAQPLNK
jgi:hypothetical protein